MRVRLLIIVATLFIVFAKCKPSPVLEKEVAIIDSTKVVLQVKLNELKRAEQNIDAGGYGKFETYRAFLKSNLPDTIKRAEATAVQVFLNSGELIQEFMQTRENLIHQTELSVSQLQKLSLDAKEHNLQSNALQAFFSTEKSHAEELVSVIEKNTKALNISLINYKNSLPRTEEFIKQINNGSLPTSINDTNVD